MKFTALTLSLPLFIFGACAQRAALTQSVSPGEAVVGEVLVSHLATPTEISRSMPGIHFGVVEDKSAEVVFASYEPTDLQGDDAFYGFRPAIIVKATPAAAPHFVSFPKLKSYDWTHASQLVSKGYFWGFLEFQVEGTAHEVPVVFSSDSGKTWSLLAFIPKHHFTDEFRDFGIDESGRGYIILKRSDALAEKQWGFDVFTTQDFGKTWSEPKFYRNLTQAKNSDWSECRFGMQMTAKLPKGCALPIKIGK
jgi:hypothetical protein